MLIGLLVGANSVKEDGKVGCPWVMETSTDFKEMRNKAVPTTR